MPCKSLKVESSVGVGWEAGNDKTARTFTIGVSSVEPISVGPGSGINSGVAATIGGFSAWNQQQQVDKAPRGLWSGKSAQQDTNVILFMAFAVKCRL